MRQSLSGKVAAITGAASGISLECACPHLNEGARVALVDRAGDALDSLCAELGADAFPVVINLTEPASVATMAPRILARFNITIRDLIIMPNGTDL
jgi:ribitol 2-dehydrogenase